MSLDRLEGLVLAGDVDGVIDAVRQATEADRLASGAAMLRLRKAHGDWAYLSGNAPRNEASLLALLGTGSAAQIAAGRRMWRHPRAGEVLLVRPEPLLVDLVPWLLEHLGWSFVRALVRDGRVPRPAGDAYIYGMLDSAVDPRELVRNDPALLEVEVWRLFEVEGTADHSLADHDKYSTDERSWSRLLLDRAGRGSDRDRLLDASLAALERDFPQFRAGWYSRFHEALAPTPAERTTRVDGYLRLLRSPLGPTVALAVGALTTVRDAGGLGGGRLLAHLAPAAGAQAAGTARAALRLAAKVVADDPALGPVAAAVVGAALAHSSADVQRDALAILERMVAADPQSDAALAPLAVHREAIVPSLQPRFEALVGHLGPEPASPAVAEPAAAGPLASARDPFTGLEPVAPTGSIEELVELLATVLEREGPPEDLERALDGVLRLAGDRPPDFVRLTGAVRARATRRLGKRPSAVAAWFAELVLAWTEGRPPPASEPDATLEGYLGARVREAAREVAAGRAGPLLALPSFRGGWIEPSALVERLRVVEAAGSDPAERPLDLAQALLRLLPGGRERALAAAADLGGEAGAAVRHAFGGNEAVGPTGALWAAAARARAPDDDDTAVLTRHPDLGPDAGRAGRYSIRVEQGRWYREPVVDPGEAAAEPAAELPAVLLWRRPTVRAEPRDETAIVDWMRLVWPQTRRSWFAVAAALLLGNLDWWEARWSNRQRLEPLFEPWTPLGREASLLLAVALQAREPAERGTAVDAFAAGVDDGRLDPARVVAAMGELATALEDQPEAAHPTTLFRPGRLATSLTEIARRSPRHAIAAHTICAGALARIVEVERPAPVPTGQLAPLLRVMVELGAMTIEPPPAACRPALEQLAARGGETGRLARRLLA